MELALKTQGLRRVFGENVAVDGIDLRVPRGCLYGFLGPNGAGKSTTIQCLTGLLRPTSGSMRVLGLDPLADPVAVKRLVGVVPEDLALFERLTGSETLSFVGQVHGLDRTTMGRRARELLEIMDLVSAAGALVADYSHGMRKKLALAVALLPAPRCGGASSSTVSGRAGGATCSSEPPAPARSRSRSSLRSSWSPSRSSWGSSASRAGS